MTEGTNKTKKISIVGDFKTGKTTLAMEFKKKNSGKEMQHLPKQHDSFKKQVIIDGDSYEVEIIDTSSNEDYVRFRSISYKDSDFFILCFAIDDVNSFKAVESYWIHELNERAPKVPCILVGLKSDLKNSKEIQQKLQEKNETFVTIDKGLKLSKKIGAFDYLEVSSFLNVNVDEIIDKCLRCDPKTQNVRRKSKSEGDCCIC